MFSDIEGSTSLTEALGDNGAQEVFRAHNSTMRELVAAHDGYEVKTIGDSFMVAFSSARDALSCALAVQAAFAESSEHQVRVRIGLHTGEAIKEGDDFFGKNVILAARIADKARGGEILVSSLVKQLVESSGEFQFDDGKDVELKGLSGSQQVFSVASQ